MNPPQDLGRAPKGPADSLLVWLLLAIFFWPFMLLWWALRRPTGALTLAALIASWVWIGLGTIFYWAFWITVFAGAGLAVWWLADRDSYRKHAGWRLRALWRKHFVYKRKWRTTMRVHQLHVPLPRRPDRIPRLVRVKSSPWVDHVLVKPLRGSISDLQSAAPALARAFNAPRCRVRHDPKRHDRFWLTFPRIDRLATPIEPPPIREDVDLTALTVGLTEDGEPLDLRILGRHLLVAGQMGSGKSILIWCLLWAMAPLIRDGVVEVHAVDPKGGMELGPGRALFAGYAQSDIGEIMGVIENVLKRMDRRMAWCEELGIQEHVPTPEEPFIWLIVDEAAVIRLLAEPSKAQQNLERWEKLILTQGRAPGVGIASCVQEPTKATLETRGLYPQRVQHRSLERTHADMTLGPGARERGAETETLDLPGKFFCTIEGVTELSVGRTFHIRKEHIATLVQNYAPRSRSKVDHLRQVLAGEIPGRPR